MNYRYTIDPVAECSILISFEEPVSVELSANISALTKQIQGELAPWLMNITPSYSTILIDYLPHRISVFELCPIIESILVQGVKETYEATEKPIIDLPVWYNEAVGPDLKHYIDQDITLEEVIKLHSQPVYNVSAIGFAPGFAFLSGVSLICNARV